MPTAKRRQANPLKDLEANHTRGLFEQIHGFNFAHLKIFLFTRPDPNEFEEGSNFLANLNPNSLEVLSHCLVEPGLAGAAVGERYQFLRQGYFSLDPDSSAQRLVFNRTVPLRDTWAKIEKQLGK